MGEERACVPDEGVGCAYGSLVVDAGPLGGGAVEEEYDDGYSRCLFKLVVAEVGVGYCGEILGDGCPFSKPWLQYE